MLEKQIYTTSRWVRFKDKIASAKKSIGKQFQDLKPKKRKVKVIVAPTPAKTPVSSTYTEAPKQSTAKAAKITVLETVSAMDSKTENKLAKPIKTRSKATRRRIKDIEEKVLVIFLLIGMISIFGSGIYFSTNNKIQFTNKPTIKKNLSPTINTGNWKTYRNDPLNFEISYPKNYVLLEKTPPEVMPKDITLHKQTSDGFETNGMYIKITDRSELKQLYKNNDPVKSLEDYVNVEIKDKEGLNSVEKITISEQEAVKTIYGNGQEFQVISIEPDILKGPIEYITFKNGRFYIIEFHSNNIEQIKLFDQILSTFKFTYSPD